MQTQGTKEIYSALDKVWPDNNIWYSYLHNTIIDFVQSNLKNLLSSESVYLNAGSGGSTYNLHGTCYHVDIAANLIADLPHSYVASVEALPFENAFFDTIICVGSVLNYCSALESISEFARTLKKGGFLVLEFERSQSAELWFSKDFCKYATLQQYSYLGDMHNLWLYSESYIIKLLKEANFNIINKKRIHSLSAIINKFTQNENYAGQFGHYDKFFSAFSYLSAHNIIMLCEKM